jgi:hypothetical protein
MEGGFYTFILIESLISLNHKNRRFAPFFGRTRLFEAVKEHGLYTLHLVYLALNDFPSLSYIMSTLYRKFERNIPRNETAQLNRILFACSVM